MIYIHIPAKFARTGKAYPAIPKELSNMAKVRINRIGRDLGPASKVLPMVKVERDPSTLIVFLDDDVLYPQDFLYTLVWTHLRHPGCVIAGHGNKEMCQMTDGIDKYTYETCMFSGFAGVLIERRMLDNCEKYIPFKKLPKSCFVSDDITLSNLFLQNGLKIVALKFRYMVAKLVIDPMGTDGEALHNMDSNFKKYMDCLMALSDQQILHPRLRIAESWMYRLIEKYGDRFLKIFQWLSPFLKLSVPRLQISRIEVTS